MVEPEHAVSIVFGRTLGDSPRTCGLNLTRRGAETLAQLGLIETAPSDSCPGLVIFAARFVCVSARGQGQGARSPSRASGVVG